MLATQRKMNRTATPEVDTWPCRPTCLPDDGNTLAAPAALIIAFVGQNLPNTAVFRKCTQQSVYPTVAPSASLPAQFVSPAPNYEQPLKSLTKVLF